MSFNGGALRSAREVSGLSLPALAVVSGVSKGTISLIENGIVKNPKMDTVERLALALNVGVAFFLAP